MEHEAIHDGYTPGPLNTMLIATFQAAEGLAFTDLTSVVNHNPPGTGKKNNPAAQ